MDNSASTVAPLLLRNLLTSIYIHADKSLINLAEKYRLLQLLRRFLVSSILFFLRLLPSFFPASTSSVKSHGYPFNSTRDDDSPAGGLGVGSDSGVARALTQLLLIMNDIPVSSRKYEVVRSLTEKLIDENLSQGNRALREVNCAVLSAAFARTLSQLEAAVVEQGRRTGAIVEQGRRTGGGEATDGTHVNDYYIYSKASSLLRGVKYCGRAVWRYARSRDELSRSAGSSAEKLAAEILWLAQKMAASSCSDEAVCKWASASNLACLALSAEPRLQGSLVKVSAFLMKEAKEIGKVKEDDEEDREPNKNARRSALQHNEIRQTKMKMLMSWLPLLCSANNGTDAPIINMSERAELERILEEIIWTLDEEEEQERVLSVWLHHFTYCPASDWPNLRSCYTRWFSASRTRLMQQQQPPPQKVKSICGGSVTYDDESGSRKHQFAV